MSFTPDEIMGKCVTFFHVSNPGKKLVGVVTAAQDNGRTPRGAIPDLLVTIRGGSGKQLTVSLVEAHVEVTL